MKSILLSIFILGSVAHADLAIVTDRTSIIDQLIADYKALPGNANEQVDYISLSTEEIKQRLEAGFYTGDLVFMKDMVFMNPLSDYMAELPQSTMDKVVPFAQTTNKKYVGVMYRARTAVYSFDVFSPEDLVTYEDLAAPEMEGFVCMRKPTHNYNQALVGFLVNTYGEERAAEIVQGWANNFADKPENSDTTMINKVIDGDCGVAIVNSYYLVRLLQDTPALADTIGISFLNQGTSGAHVNGYGAGIPNNAINPVQAQQFVDFLLSDAAQAYMSNATGHFPVSLTAVSPVEVVKSWTGFAADMTNWDSLSAHYQTALNILETTDFEVAFEAAAE